MTAPSRYSYPQRTAIAVAMAAAGALLLATIVLGINILFAAFGGLLFALLLNAFAALISRRTRLGYRVSLTLLIVGLVILLVAGGWLLAPRIAGQADQLGEQLPRLAEEAEAFLRQYRWGEWILRQLARTGESNANPLSFLGTLTDWVTHALVILFVGLFGAANPRLYRDGFVHLFPTKQRERAAEVTQALGATLRWWLIGQAITMAIIGVSTTLVLLVFGIPLAIPIGILVGLLGFIPYLGPFVGAVPIIIVGATQGLDTLLWVMLAYITVQMLEGYVAVPIVQEYTVYLPPAFTIVIEILMGAVAGLMGFIFATPLAAAMVVLHRFYRRDVLHDPEAGENLAPRG